MDLWETGLNDLDYNALFRVGCCLGEESLPSVALGSTPSGEKTQRPLLLPQDLTRGLFTLGTNSA